MRAPCFTLQANSLRVFSVQVYMEGTKHLTKDIVSGRFWFSGMNIRQKSFSNFSLSIFRAYILIILGDVMRNKGDRDTFPCCLENIFELDTDQLSLLFCPIAALSDFTNALSPFYINHQVNVAAKISLHCTSAKKRTDKLINWGFFFIIYVCFSKL